MWVLQLELIQGYDGIFWLTKNTHERIIALYFSRGDGKLFFNLKFLLSTIALLTPRTVVSDVANVDSAKQLIHEVKVRRICKLSMGKRQYFTDQKLQGKAVL